MTDAAAELAPGTVFGRDFIIVRPLRAGGMGSVYVALQQSTGKERALKVMAKELAGDPAIRERFVLEAKAAGKIESDHVVEIVTAGVDEASGAPYLVMELLRGEDLSDAADRLGPLPLGDVGEVLSQVGHALEQAHAQGIVHRDLKPENVFLAQSKRRDVAFTAKILDFGIAKLVESRMQKTTQPLGTPLFMAPEQTDRQGVIAPATDVWALGLITFKLLTGKSYWLEAEGGSMTKLLREVLVEPLVPASKRAEELGVGDAIPVGFDAWFARCVDRDASARFAEAGACTNAFVAIVPADAPRGKLVVKMSATVRAGEATSGASVDANAATAATPVRADELATSATVAAPAITAARVSATTGARASVASTQRPQGELVPAAPPPAGRRSPVVIAIVVVGALAALVVGLRFARRPGIPPIPQRPGHERPERGGPGPASSAVADAAACPTGMVRLEGGTSILGSKEGSKDAQPTHRVTLSPYCLDRTEVTVVEYEKCVRTGTCEKPPQRVNFKDATEPQRKAFSELCNARRPGRESHPINCVDWEMASTYCTWKKARLPSEAEWEMAARGKSQRLFPWGDDPPTQKRLNACGNECVAWGKEHEQAMTALYDADDGFVATAPVGSFPDGASEDGVLDLAGNVWEWTADWYGPYAEQPQTSPKGPAEGKERVIRGGAFNGSMADWAKPSFRYRTDPKTYSHAIGFRCVADVK